jgi:hypothetical protein
MFPSSFPPTWRRGFGTVGKTEFPSLAATAAKAAKTLGRSAQRRYVKMAPLENPVDTSVVYFVPLAQGRQHRIDELQIAVFVAELFSLPSGHRGAASQHPQALRIDDDGLGPGFFQLNSLKIIVRIAEAMESEHQRSLRICRTRRRINERPPRQAAHIPRHDFG